MSSQTLDLIPDIETDLEEELFGDGKAHALPFCVKHKGPEFFPVPGSIVETMCGILIRIRTFLGSNPNKKKCEKCAAWHGKVFNCYYCGAEIKG